MFHDANTEHVAIYLKLAPHLERLRQMAKYPSYLSQLERMVTRMPDLEERSRPIQAYLDHKRKQLEPSSTPSAPAAPPPGPAA
jgi:hypothetical protein